MIRKQLLRATALTLTLSTALACSGGAPGTDEDVAGQSAADTTCDTACDISTVAMGMLDGINVVAAILPIVTALFDTSQADALARLQSEMQQLSAQMVTLQKSVNEVKQGLDILNDASVKQANGNALDLLANAIVLITTAQTKISYIPNNPTNAEIISDADAASKAALAYLMAAPDPWKTWGNAANQSRFDPRVAFPVYLTAVATRLAFLKSQKTPAQLATTSSGELQSYASFIQTAQDSLINKLDAEVYCKATSFLTGGNSAGWICNVKVQCIDGVALAPDAPNPEPPTYQQITCTNAPLNAPFYEAAPNQAHRAKYWGDQMATLATGLANLAKYGYSTGPYTGSLGSVSGPIVSKMDNQVLDTLGSSVSGTRLLTEKWAHAKSQFWYFNPDGTIRNSVNGMCLDVRNMSQANGGLVELETCWGGKNQMWAWQANGTLKNVWSGKCLDIPNFSTAIGTPMEQWDCNGGVNQQFTTTAPDAQTPH